jgi:hypothetical protein
MSDKGVFAKKCQHNCSLAGRNAALCEKKSESGSDARHNRLDR